MGYLRRLLIYAGSDALGGAGAFSPNSLSPGPTSWLRIDDLGLADDAAIATGTDLSGNGNNWTQGTAGSRPTNKTNVVNGHAVARFDGTDDFWSGPDLSALTAGEIFIVVKIDNDPPAADAQTGLWKFGTHDTESDHFPYTDGVVYDGWGSTARKNTGNPTPSLATGFRLYNVVSVANEWTSFIDGTQHFTTATNTAAFSAVTRLGRSATTALDPFLDGDIAELVLFNRKLAAGEKTQMKTYFANRYALTIA